MNTAEIGTEAMVAELPPLHVITAGLGLESRIETVGSVGSSGLADIIHARSFIRGECRSRRLVLVCAAPRDTAREMLDTLDELADLPPADVAHAMTQGLAGSPWSHGHHQLQISLQVLRIDQRVVQWAGYGQSQLHHQRHPKCVGKTVLAHQGRSPELATGVCELIPGDDIIVWAGGALAPDRLLALFAESPRARAQCLQDAGTNGCLATLRRL